MLAHERQIALIAGRQQPQRRDSRLDAQLMADGRATAFATSLVGIGCVAQAIAHEIQNSLPLRS